MPPLIPEAGKTDDGLGSSRFQQQTDRQLAQQLLHSAIQVPRPKGPQVQRRPEVREDGGESWPDYNRHSGRARVLEM